MATDAVDNLCAIVKKRMEPAKKLELLKATKIKRLV